MSATRRLVLASSREVTELLARQSGVAARRQLLAAGASPGDLRSALLHRDLVIRHPGVYVDHTGEPTWLQEAWAAVLAVEPAALCGPSALDALGRAGPRSPAPGRVLHVAVDRDRSPAAPQGVRLHRMADLDARVLLRASPPRLRVEHAALDVAAAARTDLTALATLADVVQARHTTAARLSATLEARPRIARRRFMQAVLADVAAGTCSALEHGYLTRVERAHGLPTAARQVVASARGPILRDVDYRRYGVVVELDGRLFHDTARARDADLDRDLETALSDRLTVRLGWGQVFDRACHTALGVTALLQQRGWAGSPHPCPACRRR